MFLLTKMIYDPNQKYDNKMGLTIGLTVHTPKFWDCRNYDFFTSKFDDKYQRDGGIPEKIKEHRYQAMRAHRDCKRRHLSYPGYAYWTGPKRRYTFRYMGATHPREVWWKPFSVFRHNRYTQWFVGKQPGPPEPLSPRQREFLDEHVREFNEALRKSRLEMQEYVARREAEEG